MPTDRSALNLLVGSVFSAEELHRVDASLWIAYPTATPDDGQPNTTSAPGDAKRASPPSI